MERVALGIWPTPLQRATALSQHLDLDLFLKREDLAPLGLGGNKVRKLERIMASALSAGCDSVITTGAVQSNHCRITAAAAAKCGVECHLVLRGEEEPSLAGNYLLDCLFGAHCHFTRSTSHADADELVAKLEARLLNMGKKPFLIPLGGNSVESVRAFRECALELDRQTRGRPPDAVVVAFGSGSTYAGLLLGLAHYSPSTMVVGVTVADSRSVAIQKLGRHLEPQPDSATLTPTIVDRYAGAGYGLPTVGSQEALMLMARREGVLLDPTYTAKAFAGLLGELTSGCLQECRSIVFVHTGGAPSVFAYPPDSLGLSVRSVRSEGQGGI